MNNIINNKITTIVFDADDTLWVNEPYFQEAEKQFCAFLKITFRSTRFLKNFLKPK